MDCRCADGIGGLCGYETGYFKGRVNEATEEMVANRYGLPHQIEQGQGNRMVWTYFDQGSGTSGYVWYGPVNLLPCVCADI